MITFVCFCLFLVPTEKKNLNYLCLFLAKVMLNYNFYQWSDITNTVIQVILCIVEAYVEVAT